eukprot:gene2634-3399_t
MGPNGIGERQGPGVQPFYPEGMAAGTSMGRSSAYPSQRPTAVSNHLNAGETMRMGIPPSHIDWPRDPTLDNLRQLEQVYRAAAAQPAQHAAEDLARLGISPSHIDWPQDPTLDGLRHAAGSAAATAAAHSAAEAMRGKYTPSPSGASWQASASRATGSSPVSPSSTDRSVQTSPKRATLQTAPASSSPESRHRATSTTNLSPGTVLSFSGLRSPEYPIDSPATSTTTNHDLTFPHLPPSIADLLIPGLEPLPDTSRMRVRAREKAEGTPPTRDAAGETRASPIPHEVERSPATTDVQADAAAQTRPPRTPAAMPHDGAQDSARAEMTPHDAALKECRAQLYTAAGSEYPVEGTTIDMHKVGWITTILVVEPQPNHGKKFHRTVIKARIMPRQAASCSPEEGELHADRVEQLMDDYFDSVVALLAANKGVEYQNEIIATYDRDYSAKVLLEKTVMCVLDYYYTPVIAVCVIRFTLWKESGIANS